jgi:hypothetical protein
MRTYKILCCLICTIASAAALLTGCGSKDDSRQSNTITYITNYVTTIYTNTVTNVVDLTVTVPAAIPNDYLIGYEVYTNMLAATPATMEETLAGMKDINVKFFYSDPIKATVLEDDAEAKFELSLRKNGIIVNPNSQNNLLVEIDGFYTPDDNTLCYSINLAVYENKLVVINGVWRQYIVRIWTKGNSFGTVGKLKASDAIMDEIVSVSEVFANDFLKQNPK